MTRDELEAILAGKEREAGQKGQRRLHFHPCTQGCRVPEPCENRNCTYPPSDTSLPCTRQLGRCRYCGDVRLMGVLHLCPSAFAAAERLVIRGEMP